VIFGPRPIFFQDIFWDLDGSLTGTPDSYTSWADAWLGVDVSWAPVDGLSHLFGIQHVENNPFGGAGFRNHP